LDLDEDELLRLDAAKDVGLVAIKDLK